MERFHCKLAIAKFGQQNFCVGFSIRAKRARRARSDRKTARSLARFEFHEASGCRKQSVPRESRTIPCVAVGFLLSAPRSEREDARGASSIPVFLSIDTRGRSLRLEKFIFAVTNAAQEAREPVDGIVGFVVVVVASSASTWSSLAFVFVVVFASGARPDSRVSQRHLLEIERPNNLPRITSDASLLLSLSLPRSSLFSSLFLSF